jgi:ribonuclease HI
LGDTYAIETTFKSFVPPATACLPSHCRQISTLKDPIDEVSFAEFLVEEEEDGGMGDAKSVTSTVSSGKRKRNAGPAFYAVRVGRTPGIYYSWPDCEAQIRGMKAECRVYG